MFLSVKREKLPEFSIASVIYIKSLSVSSKLSKLSQFIGLSFLELLELKD